MKPASRVLAALAASVFTACTCGTPAAPTQPATPPGTGEGTAAGGTGAAKALAQERLDPAIRELAPYQGMPTQVVFEFPRAIAGGADLNRPIAGKTILLVNPATKGTLAFSGRSTLAFTPSQPFLFGTRYGFTLDAVETSEGVFSPPKPGAWSHSFVTPAFAFRALSPEAIDLKAGTATVSVTFTGPVDPNAVSKLAAFEVEGQPVTQARYSGGKSASSEVRVYLASKSFKPGAVVRFALKEGLASDSKPSAKAPAAEASFNLFAGKKVKIWSANLQEGATGSYVEVSCHDEAATPGNGAAYAGGEEESGEGEDEYSYRYGRSPGCVLQEEGAAEAIHFDPQVKFSIAPSRGGFRIFGDFKRGTYAMRIDAGAGSVAGGILFSTYDKSFSVPARKPQLSFTSQGRYLPRQAWRNLPIQHLNLEAVELTVRHVPQENLVFWLGNDSSDATTERDSDLLLTKTIPVRGEPDTLTTTWIDVGSLVPKDTKGLVELTVESGGVAASSRILLTDLSLVAKKGAAPQGGSDGQEEVWVWALDIGTGEPLSGVDISLVRKSGKAVAHCSTSGEKGCTLKRSGEDPDPAAPFALVARKGDELTYLRYSDLKTDLSESDVSGEPFSAAVAYRAALYSDRGVYRPGDTAHLAAIVRGKDDLAPPPGMPVELQLADPRQRPVRKAVLKTNEGGMVTLDVPFAAFADTGPYAVTLSAGGKPIGQYAFQVEEFVPERMKVTAAADRTGYRLGAKVPVKIDAKYLFGGSAEGANVELTCKLQPAELHPKENAQYHFGLWEGRGDKKALTLGQEKGTLDKASSATLECPPLEDTGGFKGTARLVATAAVFEAGSGRTTNGDTSVLLHPEAYYLGLRSPAQKAVAGKPFSVSGIVTGWDGALFTEQAKAPQKVDVELYRLDAEYGYTYDEESGGEHYQRYLRPVREGKLQAQVSGGKFSFDVTPASRCAGFLVRVKSGGAQSELQLTGEYDGYYWYGAESRIDQTPKPMRPTALVLKAPAMAKVGERLEVKFEAPYQGRALLTAETDRVIAAEWLTVKAGENAWSVPLEKFSPNVYLSAFLVKDPHLESKESFLPDRAFGVVSVPVEPTEFTQPLTLKVPEEVRSSSTLTVDVELGKTDGPAYVTVAAVDEGILSLTKFKSPNPFESLFVRRALGVETYETIGWTLLVPPQGPQQSTGGDEEVGANGGAGRVQPVKPVALWSGPVKAGADGKARISFPIPQYRGALRIMAVAATPKRVGKASAEVKVRDPLVLSTTLPRFIAKGDEVQIPVFVTNLSGKPLEVKISLTAEDLPLPGSISLETGSSPLQLLGKPEGTIKLGNEKAGTVVFQARAVKATGAARLRVKASAGEFESTDELDVPFLPAGPRERMVQTLELAEGGNDLKPRLRGWLPGTENTTVWVTNNPYGESFDHLKYLVHYPYGCIEQTTSSTRPLLFVANLLESVDPSLFTQGKLDDMVMSGVNRVFSMQTPSGGFAYWPGGTDPNTWGTAYATHMLLDAQKLGYPVPQERLSDATDYLGRELTGRERIDPGNAWSYDEPYMQYVLALAGKAHKARIEKLLQNGPADRPSGYSHYSCHDCQEELAEQLYLLKAALWLGGDRRYEKDLKSPDLRPITDFRNNYWSFYSDRRYRGLVLSTFQDLFGKDPAGEPLAELVARGLAGHDSGWYTTQELVWGITGLGKRVQTGAKDFKAPTLLAGGKAVKHAPPKEKIPDRTWSLMRASEAQTLVMNVEEKLNGKLYAIVSSEGVREQSEYPVGGSGLKVDRTFHQLDGTRLDLVNKPVSLADLVVVEIALTNTSNNVIQNIALVDRLPAGFEIENPRLARGQPLEWVERSQLWEADYMNVRDDRVELFGSLRPGETKKVVYAARVVTAGKFALPPVEAEAMYDPRIWARQAGGQLTVEGPWKDFLL